MPFLGVAVSFLLQFFLTRNVTAAQNETQFDYVIVGGGTAGLVLANRLSADPSVTVAVIEVGDSVLNNPNVTSVTAFPSQLGSSIDWLYVSAPQTYAGNATVQYHAGKALGGTSTINGMTYLRAESSQIDAWERLGNDGWNWASMYPFYKKSERLEPPNSTQIQDGAAYNPAFHGFAGPVTVGWSSYEMGQNVSSILNATCEAVGVPYNPDANGGSMRGFTVWPFTLDASKNIRQDAARAYYWPVASIRKNLVAFTNTTATKITWNKSSCGDQIEANGVEVVTQTGKSFTISAKGEVILSAGSLRSPALLELSGVGNPAILEKIGIDVVLSLPSVGENFQDQTLVGLEYLVPDNFTGSASFVTLATASDLFASELPSVASAIRKTIPALAATISEQSHNSTTAAIQEKLLNIHADVLFGVNNEGSSVPLAELLWNPTTEAVAMPLWGLLPFSRGNIHITSDDPLATPSISPNFWMADADITMHAAAMRLARKLFATPPLSNLPAWEAFPGFATVPEDASDEIWGKWLKANYQTNDHPLGSCAMMSKDLGGVVDSELRVYGTANVRVVDASVLPMQTSGHLSSTIYALAERAATIIEKNNRKR